MAAFATGVSAQGVSIKNTALPGGGQALTIQSKQPDVTHKSRFGPVFADQTQRLPLSTDKLFAHHSGNVALYLLQANLLLRADNLTDPGHGPVYITGSLTIQAAGGKPGSNTFECRDGTVYFNGESTGRTSIESRDIFVVSCSGSTILIEPKKR